MVDVQRRVFFAIGEDFFCRRQAIEHIKNRLLRSKSASLNTVVFYSKEIEADRLKEQVLNFSFGGEKILIFKNADKLPAAAKDFIAKNFKKIISANYLILDIEKSYPDLRRDKKITADKFFTFFLRRATVIKVSSPPRPPTLDDFRASIRRRDCASSLYLLEKLFAGGGKGRDLGPKMLGIIVYEFSRLKNHRAKKSYFTYLWDTDRAIKERGLSSRLALEVLLAKILSSSEESENFSRISRG